MFAQSNTAVSETSFQEKRPKRILVVDDEPDIRRLNTKILCSHGYQVDSADDGISAWEIMQQNNYDLLVTDNQMSHLNGIELIKKLHDLDIIVPAVLATGVPPTEELKKHPGLPIKALLLKPYSVAALLATVSRVLDEMDGPSHISGSANHP